MFIVKESESNLTAKCAKRIRKEHKVHIVRKQSTQRMTENELANKVIGIGIEVHNALGPGLLESAYKECIFYKLSQSGFFVEKEKRMPLVFEEIEFECGYRIDLLVENKLVLELKSVETLNDVHLAQTLTYLKLGELN